MSGQLCYILIKIVFMSEPLVVSLLQSFTVCDALLLEEYFFVSLCELYDWAKSEWITQVPDPEQTRVWDETIYSGALVPVPYFLHQV